MKFLVNVEDTALVVPTDASVSTRTQMDVITSLESVSVILGGEVHNKITTKSYLSSPIFGVPRLFYDGYLYIIFLRAFITWDSGF